MTRERRLEALRLVLFVYGFGHLVTAAMFLFWPQYFLEGTGARPPWPLSGLQFGSWPPTHEGFMAIIGVYDIAVAIGLFIAMTNPVKHVGLLQFATVLWVLHGAAHGALIVWGTSPGRYWGAVVELWLGAALLIALYPRGTNAGELRPPPPL